MLTSSLALLVVATSACSYALRGGLRSFEFILSVPSSEANELTVSIGEAEHVRMKIPSSGRLQVVLPPVPSGCEERIFGIRIDNRPRFLGVTIWRGEEEVARFERHEIEVRIDPESRVLRYEPE
jgi:hypothetical protein